MSIIYLKKGERLIPPRHWSNRSFGVICGKCKTNIDFDVVSKTDNVTGTTGTIDLLIKIHECKEEED